MLCACVVWCVLCTILEITPTGDNTNHTSITHQAAHTSLHPPTHHHPHKYARAHAHAPTHTQHKLSLSLARARSLSLSLARSRARASSLSLSPPPPLFLSLPSVSFLAGQSEHEEVLYHLAAPVDVTDVRILQRSNSLCRGDCGQFPREYCRTLDFLSETGRRSRGKGGLLSPTRLTLKSSRVS
jgi:hypothetical protein